MVNLQSHTRVPKPEKKMRRDVTGYDPEFSCSFFFNCYLILIWLEGVASVCVFVWDMFVMARGHTDCFFLTVSYFARHEACACQRGLCGWAQGLMSVCNTRPACKWTSSWLSWVMVMVMGAGRPYVWTGLGSSSSEQRILQWVKKVGELFWF